MHLNVGLTISCTDCKKTRLFYAKYKLKSNELTSLKRIWNDIRYICRTIMEDIPIDERNKDCGICDRVCIRENLGCMSNIEVPYYSCKIFKEVWISCRIKNQLIPSDDIHFPQCHNCRPERVKRNKRKQVLRYDRNANKKQKTLV